MEFLRIREKTRSGVTITASEVTSKGVNDLFVKRKNPMSAPRYGKSLNDLTKRIILFDNDICHALHHIRRRRSTDSTEANDTSSRSHLIVTIRINNDVGANDATFVLVDLAGLETFDDEDRDTSLFINLSLNVLFKVINANTGNSLVTPYRDLLLTMCLKPFMGEDTKITLIANIRDKLQSYRGDQATLGLVSSQTHRSRRISNRL